MIEINDRVIYITATAGMSHYPVNGCEAEELLHQAEVAKFKIQRKGLNNFLVYLSEDKEIIARNYMFELSINKAIQHNYFYLVYQPEMNLVTEEV